MNASRVTKRSLVSPVDTFVFFSLQLSNYPTKLLPLHLYPLCLPCVELKVITVTTVTQYSKDFSDTVVYVADAHTHTRACTHAIAQLSVLQVREKIKHQTVASFKCSSSLYTGSDSHLDITLRGQSTGE